MSGGVSCVASVAAAVPSFASFFDERAVASTAFLLSSSILVFPSLPKQNRRKRASLHDNDLYVPDSAVVLTSLQDVSQEERLVQSQSSLSSWKTSKRTFKRMTFGVKSFFE